MIPRVTDKNQFPSDPRDDIEIGLTATQIRDFSQSTSESGNRTDWGKIRHSIIENVYGTGSSLTNYPRNYSMDGTGVDIVIQDSGLQVDHPEFNDANGNSRVQLIDWFSASGVTGSKMVNHYGDTDGHGTHCGGTATGLHFGWAQMQEYIASKVGGLEGSGDP